MDLGIAIIIMIMIIVLLLRWVCVFGLVFSSFVSLSFIYLEIIKSVYGLRWMCCGGGVGWYIEFTNVVRSVKGGIVTTWAIKGAELGFQTPTFTLNG